MIDERARYMTAEEIAEKVRARRLKTRVGFLFAVGSFLTGIFAAIIEKDLITTVVFLTVAMVSAGFVHPSEVRAMWPKVWS